MSPSKTAAPLKGIFEPAKAQAAQAVMQPASAPAPVVEHGSRNRKAGGRSVRVSGYIPEEINEALRDEVIKRTVATRHSVSFNDVLCSILADWHERQKAAQ
jgi:hypothetical protein